MSSGLAEAGGFETQIPKQERHLQVIPDAPSFSIDELEGARNQTNQVILSTCRFLGRRLLDGSEANLLNHYEEVLAAASADSRENVAWGSERFQKLSKPAMFSIFDRLFNDSSADVRSAVATNTESHIDMFTKDRQGSIYFMLDNLTYPVQR
jgi:hypothetical protein